MFHFGHKYLKTQQERDKSRFENIFRVKKKQSTHQNNAKYL